MVELTYRDRDGVRWVATSGKYRGYVRFDVSHEDEVYDAVTGQALCDEVASILNRPKS